MRILTLRQVIEGVADAWRRQYQHKNGWKDTILGSSEIIYNRLLALDLTTCKVEDVNEVIGNSSWTQLECDECEKPANVVVVFETDSECGGAKVCPVCITGAADALFSIPSEAR